MFDALADPSITTVNQLQRLDNSAWSKFVDQYFARIYRWCLDAGIEPHSAFDITQNVFLSVLQSIHRYSMKDSGTFGGWVRRITQRRIADHFRCNRVGIIGPETLQRMPSGRNSQGANTNPTNSISSEVVSDERVLRATRQAKLEFKDYVWSAFWMVAVEGKSVEETATELKTTKNVVYLSRSRVGKRLQQILKTARPLD